MKLGDFLFRFCNTQQTNILQTYVCVCVCMYEWGNTATAHQDTARKNVSHVSVLYDNNIYIHPYTIVVATETVQVCEVCDPITENK